MTELDPTGSEKNKINNNIGRGVGSSSGGLDTSISDLMLVNSMDANNGISLLEGMGSILSILGDAAGSALDAILTGGKRRKSKKYGKIGRKRKTSRRKTSKRRRHITRKRHFLKN